eukprot:SAG22_NODE_8309_length_665_cov_1.203180_1_plen_53_part_01
MAEVAYVDYGTFRQEQPVKLNTSKTKHPRARPPARLRARVFARWPRRTTGGAP